MHKKLIQRLRRPTAFTLSLNGQRYVSRLSVPLQNEHGFQERHAIRADSHTFVHCELLM